MSDFYETLQEPVLRKLKPLAAARDKLRREVEQMRSRIADIERTLPGKSAHVESLRAEAGASLSEGADGWERYQKSLRSRKLELANLSEELDDLRLALQQKRDELLLAERRLEDSVTLCLGEHRPVCEQAMSELLGQVVGLHDSWMSTWERLCADVNVSFNRSKREHLPVPSHPRIDAHRFNLITPETVEERLHARDRALAQPVKKGKA